MKRLIVVGACLTGLVVTACGTPSAGSASTTVPTPTPLPPTPSPSPSVDPILAAGQYYLKVVTTYNAAEAKVAAAEKKIFTYHPYTAAVPDEKVSLAATEAWQNALYAYTWPANAQGQIDALVSANEGFIEATEAFIAGANVTTWDAMGGPGRATSEAAAAVRLTLHLPPIAP